MEGLLQNKMFIYKPGTKREYWVTNGTLRLLFNMSMKRVLRRDKFHLQEETIKKILVSIKQYGSEVHPKATGEALADPDDQIFYELAMEKRDDHAYLITGNQKHFPDRDFIVTPAQMIHILDKHDKTTS